MRICYEVCLNTALINSTVGGQIAVHLPQLLDANMRLPLLRLLVVPPHQLVVIGEVTVVVRQIGNARSSIAFADVVHLKSVSQFMG